MYNPTEAIGSVHTDMTTLANKNAELRSRIEAYSNTIAGYAAKILNVKEYITEVYMEDSGDISDELKHIAELLEITLTKRIAGTASINITWEAQVPLDFHPDDLDLSFSVDANNYEIEDFSYNEDGIDIEPEMEY